MVQWLNDISKDDFALVGGKAFNLGALYQAGISVPNACVITSDSYQAYVDDNNIQGTIATILESDDSSHIKEERIKALFRVDLISTELEEDIALCRNKLRVESYAVRSSATVEDLPGMSFAGQYSTFLNVAPDHLTHAILDCWKSLWNSRAIDYRKKNGIEDEFQHCVLVQEMVESQVSGVIFTANPLSGARNELLINASYGLGESIVNGDLIPDQYIINKTTQCLVSEEINVKQIYSHYSRTGITNSALPKHKQHQSCLSQALIKQVSATALSVEAFFGKAQDIEFSIDDQGHVYVVQSRDITTLYPIDTFDQDGKNRAYLLASNVLLAVREAWTPLGANLYGGMFPTVINFMTKPKKKVSDSFVKYDGNRILLDITYLLSSRLVAKQLGNIFSGNDLALKATMNHLVDHHGAKFRHQGIRFRIPWGMFKYTFSVLPYIKEARRYKPTEKYAQVKKLGEAFYQERLKKAEQVSSLDEKWAFANETMVKVFALTQKQGFYCLEVNDFDKIKKIIHKRFGNKYTMDVLTYALPNCLTLEIGMALNHMAQYFDENNLEPTKDHPKVRAFLDQYGYRGDIELDFGTPRWKEDPEFIISQIKSYMLNRMYERNLQDHEDKAKQAEAFIEEIYEALKEVSNERYAAKLAKRMRLYRIAAGMREYPKFNIVQGLDVARKLILEEGVKMSTQGILESPEDIFFLNKDQLLMKDQSTFKTIVRSAKEHYKKEMQRINIPRVIFNTGETFYSALPMDPDSDLLQGIPLSAGTYEGIIRIVRDPKKSDLKEGEILVTETTNPAWTPLFATAKGLIMEHGGPLSHGGIVAREYGIPAVVGIPTATNILKDGQRVRINGETGTVQIIKDE